ncbi:hypothetical protein HOY80DRAFT_272975 [Tuber brumale]|nr:hypothetical protein HOY80DRAFT_272975 [Tuber brumale]
MRKQRNLPGRLIYMTPLMKTARPSIKGISNALPGLPNPRPLLSSIAVPALFCTAASPLRIQRRSPLWPTLSGRGGNPIPGARQYDTRTSDRLIDSWVRVVSEKPRNAWRYMLAIAPPSSFPPTLTTSSLLDLPFAFGTPRGIAGPSPYQTHRHEYISSNSPKPLFPQNLTPQKMPRGGSAKGKRQKQKFYAVYRGRNSGIFDDWIETRLQVEGFSEAIFKSFTSRDEAEFWIYEQRDKEIREENARLRMEYPDTDEDESGTGEQHGSSCPQFSQDDTGLRVNYPDLDALPARLSAYGGNGAGAPSYLPTPSNIPPSSFTPKQRPEASPSLDTDQKRVLSLVERGHNVFFTGPAGSGKSLILKHIKHYLDSIGKTYAITAPTGIASVLIGGQTIHSWSRVGKGDKSIGYYIHKSKSTVRHPEAKSQGKPTKSGGTAWKETQVLIIDEISMISLRN